MVVGWLAISVSAFAADSTYIGAGIFIGNVDYANKKVGMFDDIRPSGGMIRLGTYLVPKIAIEARYMDASGEESASDGEGEGKADFDLHIMSGLVKADLPKIGKAQLYGLLGWSSVHLEAPNVSNKYSGASFGFGIEANMTEYSFISAEYNHVVNVELCDVAGFTILANIKF